MNTVRDNRFSGVAGNDVVLVTTRGTACGVRELAETVVQVDLAEGIKEYASAAGQAFTIMAVRAVRF